MAKRSKKVVERDRVERLGEKLRDLALHAEVGHNPMHDDPAWKAVPSYGLKAWTAIMKAMLASGWRPPLEWEEDE